MTVAVRIAAPDRARCSKTRWGMLPEPDRWAGSRNQFTMSIAGSAGSRPGSGPRRDQALHADQHEIGRKRHDDRQDGADEDLGQEEAIQAFGDEEPESAEALAEDRGDRRQPDRRHDRE